MSEVPLYSGVAIQMHFGAQSRQTGEAGDSHWGPSAPELGVRRLESREVRECQQCQQCQRSQMCQRCQMCQRFLARPVRLE